MLINANGGDSHNNNQNIVIGDTVYRNGKAFANVFPNSSSTQQTTANTGTTRKSNSGSSSNVSADSTYNAGNSYTDYLAAIQAARLQKIAAVNAALDQQGKAAEQKYQNQLTQIAQDYQTLKNQSEVNRYKAQKNLREAMANRGLLDSGAGRQETLTLQNNYGNALNKIGEEENREKNNVYTAINQLWADINTKKAENESSASDSVEGILQTLINSGAYNYSPTDSSNYSDAKNSIVSGLQTNSANADTATTQAALTAKAAQQKQNTNDYWKNLYLQGKITYDQLFKQLYGY